MSDIIKGKNTLLVIKSLDLLSPENKDKLVNILKNKKKSKKDIDLAIELVKNSGSLDYCRKKSMALIEDAKSALKDIPDSEYKKDIIGIADFVVQRAF